MKRGWCLKSKLHHINISLFKYKFFIFFIKSLKTKINLKIIIKLFLILKNETKNIQGIYHILVLLSKFISILFNISHNLKYVIHYIYAM